MAVWKLHYRRLFVPTRQCHKRVSDAAKYTAIVALLLFLLLWRLLLPFAPPPAGDDARLYQKQEDGVSWYSSGVGPSCVRTELGGGGASSPLLDRSPRHGDWRRQCRHIAPPRGLCSLLHDLFYSQRPVPCTPTNTSTTFCTWAGASLNCAVPAACHNLSVSVGEFTDGVLAWHPTAPQQLQRTVQEKLTSQASAEFVLLRCGHAEHFEEVEDFAPDDHSSRETGYYHEQFVMMPVLPPAADTKVLYNDTTRYDDLVNVNLVLIDSVSRNSFYRSLPRTVSVLDKLFDGNLVDVLDYKFLQALKHRTYENLQGVFSGYINLTEKSFGTYDVPSKPLPVQNLFWKFKRNGYSTLWLEDLCWKWEWGIIKDLKVMNHYSSPDQGWVKLAEALKYAGIDSTGITHASCHILSSNGLKDPFHAKRSTCFNGRNHHDYTLEYLQRYQLLAHQEKRNVISFTEINIAHEDTGLFIQNLDDDLVNYLKFVSTNLSNTLTVLFSDHGSTYGKFIQSTPEAYVEMYNPFMFLIIPTRVAHKIGSYKMDLLRSNTERLVTLIDLHPMLLQLIDEKPTVEDEKFNDKYVTLGGLFGNIPKYRTCAELPLLQPNLCICQNFESNSEPSVFHNALAEFGLGVLNSMILSEREQHSSEGGYGRCLPLRGVKVRKVVQVRVRADLTHYKLDVAVVGVEAGESFAVVPRGREYLGVRDVQLENHLFFLVVQAAPSDPPLSLVSYERMSPYSSYKSCADEHVEVKLCVCNMPESINTVSDKDKESVLFKHAPSLVLPNHSAAAVKAITIVSSFVTSTSFGVAPVFESGYPQPNICTLVFRSNFKSGVVLYGVNLCDYFVNIEVSVTSKNVYLSNSRRATIGLRSMDLKLLVAGVVDNPRIHWSWTHRLWFTRL